MQGGLVRRKLSVLSNVWIVTKQRNFCPDFIPHERSLSHVSEKSGGRGRPFLQVILGQPAPEIANFESIFTRCASVASSKKMFNCTLLKNKKLLESGNRDTALSPDLSPLGGGHRPQTPPHQRLRRLDLSHWEQTTPPQTPPPQRLRHLDLNCIKWQY